MFVYDVSVSIGGKKTSVILARYGRFVENMIAFEKLPNYYKLLIYLSIKEPDQTDDGFK